MKAEAVVLDSRLTHHPYGAQIAPHGFWQRQEVGFGHNRRVSGTCQAHRNIAVERCTKAPWPFSEPAVGDHEKQEDVPHRARPRIVPRRQDDHLRQHQRDGADDPDAPRRGQHGHGAGHDQQARHQPQEAHPREIDWVSCGRSAKPNDFANPMRWTRPCTISRAATTQRIIAQPRDPQRQRHRAQHGGCGRTEPAAPDDESDEQLETRVRENANDKRNSRRRDIAGHGLARANDKVSVQIGQADERRRGHERLRAPAPWTNRMTNSTA